ncbi:hypothetical protein PFBG_05748 [Plasmodium falciparum 7G8]|uniref:Uncharacterized protein n=3 Tax=Plasmodium falciparum TaxID=5833 RepID=A0A024V0K1_PLAFA|nr:hypothetical protein PFFVO_05319 [Plasmodium falciparum Vietnam Oak-Knoll (FVO)]ETW39563.1 hypothetical protein PFNF135_05593 [Plasmodium falciparum NF135/5.C10]EUR62032.1 hypothetical protein PFBG_05748 [Plasmodium falciparum 7G8]
MEEQKLRLNNRKKISFKNDPEIWDCFSYELLIKVLFMKNI